jgi:phosphohistidine swiveling domain-containing protein
MSEHKSNWIRYFSDPLAGADGDPKRLLGGKGASLKEMSLAGLAVPPGFTIGTTACARYFERQGQWPDGLESEIRANLERLERETGRHYAQGRDPLLVSVRSGAALSMPGMMDTILHVGLHPGLAEESSDPAAFWAVYVDFIRMFAKVVKGIEPAAFEEGAFERGDAPCDRRLAEAYLRAYEGQSGEPFPLDPWDLLLRSVRAVFESWHSDRAAAYRRKNDIRGLLGTAVNVQAMFPSEVSGVVFTEDPNNLPAGRLVIEASYGLGESVVSGDVTPDRYLVNRKTRAVEAAIGHKHYAVHAFGAGRAFDPSAPCLSPEQLRELGDLALRVESHFGYPVDIEFGLAGGRFAMLQARRIRGLEVVEDVEIGRREEVFRLRELAGGRRRGWVIHNLAETLRAPTPLTWDVVRQFMTGDGGFGRMYRDLGYQPSARVRREGFLELICGRIFADPERLAELFWDAMPLTYDVKALLADKRLLDRAPNAFDPDRASGRFLARLPATLWRMARSSRAMRLGRRDAQDRFERRMLPPFMEYVRRKREQPLATLGDEALLAELTDRRIRVLDEFGPESLRPGFFGGLAYEGLEGRLTQVLGPEHGGELARTLTRALDGDTTFEQDAMLDDAAHGRCSLDAFLERFGHRGVGEMELAVPRWREDPSYLRQMLQRLASATGHTPRRIHEENLGRRREAERDLPAVLARHGGSSFLEDVQRDMKDAQALLPYRETGKFYLMMGYDLIRRVTEALAERWDLGGRLYFLRLDELPTYRGRETELREQIERRRIRHQALQRLDVPDVIDSDDLERLGLVRELGKVSELTGVAVASGVATGTARVVFSPQEAGDLGTDYILVCPSTDPGWTPLFLHARGLIVERGGVLSHGAIVARDFGIPAAVCADATRLIQPGDRIRVDGNTGKVVVLERAGG